MNVICLILYIYIYYQLYQDNMGVAQRAWHSHMFLGIFGTLVLLLFYLGFLWQREVSMFALPPFFRCEMQTLPWLKVNPSALQNHVFLQTKCLFAGMYACKIIFILRILHTDVYIIIYNDIYFYPHIPYTHMNMIRCIYVFIIQTLYISFQYKMMPTPWLSAEVLSKKSEVPRMVP